MDNFKLAYAIVAKDAFQAYITNQPNTNIYLQAVISLDFAIQTELEFVEC